MAANMAAVAGPELVAAEVAAWEAERNVSEAKVRWRFRTEDARIKLEKLYPVVQWPGADPRTKAGGETSPSGPSTLQ